MDRTAAMALLTCPIPSSITEDEMAAWMARSLASNISVTWIVRSATLALTVRAVEKTGFDSPPSLALDVSQNRPHSRQQLRHLIRQSRSIWPSLESVIVYGSGSLRHRDTLVEEGIKTIAVDSFDDTHRVTRRPAPEGWPCRSILWGLWELALQPRTHHSFLETFGRLIHCNQNKGLLVRHVDLAQRRESLLSMRKRYDKHLRWAHRQSQNTNLEFISLTDLPIVLQQSSSSTFQGSVLRAA